MATSIDTPRASNEQRPRWWLTGLAYVASFTLLTVAAGSRRWLGVAASAVLFAVASFHLNRDLLKHRTTLPRRVRHLVPWLVVAISLALVVAWRFAGRTDGVGFFGACLFLVGMGLLLTEWRLSATHVSRWGGAVVALCAAAFLAGLAAAPRAFVGWIVVAVALLVAPIGLSLLSEGVLHVYELRDPRSRRTLLISGIAFPLGIWLLVLFGLELRYALLISVSILILVFAITSNTQWDIFIILVSAGLLWSVTPRGVLPGPEVLLENGETAMAALGDSYISGEGAQRFYAGTNHRDENECRRAPTAYPPLVVAARNGSRPANVAFVACSGAKAAHIFEGRQYPGEPVGGPTYGAVRGLNQIDHLDWLRKDKDVRIDVVVMSVGGNDALFGQIGRSCIAPGDCSEIGSRWLDNLSRVRFSVDRAYQEVRNYIGNDVPVLVVPYPVPISEKRCAGSLFTANEHRFINRFAGELNRVLARAAADAGLYYLNDMVDALRERKLRICDAPAKGVGVNFIGVNPLDGRIEQSIYPGNWLHNSLHPNERGHQAMAAELRAWLDARPELAPRPDPLVEVGPPSIRRMEEIMGDRRFEDCASPSRELPGCDGLVDQWLITQVTGAVWRSLVPLIAVVAGAWTLSLWLILTVAPVTSRGKHREARRSGRSVS